MHTGGIRRHRRDLGLVGEHVPVRQKEIGVRASEHHHLDLGIAFQRANQILQLADRIRIDQVNRRVIERRRPQSLGRFAYRNLGHEKLLLCVKREVVIHPPAWEMPLTFRYTCYLGSVLEGAGKTVRYDQPEGFA